MANRRDIVNPSHRGTQFVGAGLQIFEDVIEQGASPLSGPLFVPQPVIRLNYFTAVGNTPGTSTSFLNLCTEAARSSVPEFLAHFSIWLDLLRKLRVRTSDVTIILSTERWSGGTFAGACVVIEVAGTEVGDAVLIDEGAVGACDLLPIADFSFGLERLVWVLNPGLPYYAFIGALPETTVPENERVIDRIRTATLMCAAGVSPSSRGHGRHLRRTIADGVEQYATIDLALAIAHAHQYWSQFFTPYRGLAECRRILESEWTRARTVDVSRYLCPAAPVRLGASAVSTNDLCRRLFAAGANFEKMADYAARNSGRSQGNLKAVAE